MSGKVERFMIGTYESYLNFALVIDENYRNYKCLFASHFSRSRTLTNAVCASFDTSFMRIGNTRYSGTVVKTILSDGRFWNCFTSQVNMGHDRFYCGLNISSEINSTYLVTSEENVNVDLYEFLMNNYKLNLQKWWMPNILQHLLKCKNIKKPAVTIYGNESASLPLHREKVCIKNLVVYDFSGMNEEMFENAISSLLKSKEIWISKSDIPPLDFHTMDDYILNYGHTLVDNLNKQINPLIPLKANVDTAAIKKKSLFPQQAACVNGLVALQNSGSKFGIMLQGMGVGKTIQAAVAAESLAVSKYLKNHPDKTLKDVYMDENCIKYRVVVIAPGHLVEKWKLEIEKEIPFAKATIVKAGIKELFELREKGKNPEGKEFYIMSKDLAKLDGQYAPIPYRVAKQKINLSICADCYHDVNANGESNSKIVYKRFVDGKPVCPDCGGHNFMPYYDYAMGEKVTGLTCPECDRLLLANTSIDPDSDYFITNREGYVLTPDSFASRTNKNAACYHCGTSLWTISTKPKMLPGSKAKEAHWYKATHYKNHSKKTKQTAFILKNHEELYTKNCITTEGWTESDCYGPRKVSAAHFAKRYLKGFFDLCILDEAHKYLGASAQGRAAHVFSKCSNFTLALTGTISNGTAACFFYLYWMFEPRTMVELGYKFNSKSLMEFAKTYGCVETAYETTKNDSRNKNSHSRGRQLRAPSIKPGISPVLFGKFLLDKCVLLDISDLSKYLPKLIEKTCLVPMPEEIKYPYSVTIDTLKKASMNGSGRGVLSIMLQYGLANPDKPYGFDRINDPYSKNGILCQVDEFPEYADINSGMLLPKEEKLIELVNQEIGESRNCFIYASFTGKEDYNVTYRLKAIIEKYCNLEDRVEIIQSRSPQASKREAWFHERASKGIKVFITNPANVETGLDFCFEHMGMNYNYPTLIFYQTGYQLQTVWQASRRAYRLNQTEECHNYYLAYEGTVQADALEIMARKMVATAAIQGHFSTEGLAEMASGIDVQAELAARLSAGDTTDRESIENMFDVLAGSNADETDDTYNGFVPSPSYYELTGKEEYSNTDELAFEYDVFNCYLESNNTKDAEISTKETKEVIDDTYDFKEVFEDDFNFDDAFDNFFISAAVSQSSSQFKSEEKQPDKKRRTKKSELFDYNSVSIFDL